MEPSRQRITPRLMRSIPVDNPSNLLNVMAINRLEHENLCNCVYCWCYDNTKHCLNCKKKFCQNHVVKHSCFSDLEVWN